MEETVISLVLLLSLVDSSVGHLLSDTHKRPSLVVVGSHPAEHALSLPVKESPVTATFTDFKEETLKLTGPVSRRYFLLPSTVFGCFLYEG